MYAATPYAALPFAGLGRVGLTISIGGVVATSLPNLVVLASVTQSPLVTASTVVAQQVAAAVTVAH